MSDLWQIGGLVLLVVALILFGRWFAGWGVGAPFLPVRRRDIEDAFALVDVSAGDVVVDLGSGDGRLLVAAAERGASVVGYELNPFLVWLARHRLRSFGDRARVIRGDLRRADLSQASVVFVFGITHLMPEIAELVRRSGTPGLKIVSFAFELPGFEARDSRGIARLYRLTG